MSDLEQELHRHFTAAKAAKDQAQIEREAANRKAEDLRGYVAGVMEGQILPEMTKAQNFLLSQDLPAQAKLVANVGGGTHSAVVGLYCSNDIKDYRKPPEEMMFYAAYVLDQGGVYYRTNRSTEMKKDSEGYSSPVPLADLTAQTASRHLIDFVKAAFPL